MLSRSLLTIMFLSMSAANAASLPLYYKDVERILLSKNKNIQIAKLNKEQSEHDVSSSYSGFWPTLTLYNDTSKTYDTSETKPKKIYSTYVELTQNIFSGFQDYYKVQDAKLSLDQVKNDLTKEELAQISELKVAFANVLMTQRMVNFSERIIETRKNIKELVSLRLSSGNETKDSMLFAEAQLEESGLDLETSQKTLAAARRKLKFILGEELPEDFQITGGVDLVSMPTNPNFQELATNSLEFQNASLTQRRGLEDISRSRAKFLPTVDFTVSRERENKRNYSQDDYNRTYITKYMLSVTFPLFEGFSTYHDMRKTVLESEKNKLSLAKVSEDYYTDLRDTYDKLMELKKRKQVYQKLLEAAKMREMIDTSKYKLGIISFEVWIDSQNDLISYEKNVIEIDFDIETNLSKWETLTNVRS